ncbi:hypothetical protein FD755_014738, partial [Muntiacus reevesi]
MPMTHIHLIRTNRLSMYEEIMTHNIWHPGERCLAPSPDNEKLCEASIKSITVDENGKSFAVILYSDFQERRVSLKRLQEVKSVKDCARNFIFDDEDLEKPYFPDRKFPSSAVPFQLSENGDSIPYTINRYLRDYQREGAQFLHGHFIRGRGCILGDDMGLGKTVQFFQPFFLFVSLYSLEWSAIIVDEVHRIKNPKARVTEVMKALKCNVRIGLTGTILQNNMKELWCVMDWAVPGLLGSRIHFKKQFSDPVEHGQRHTATKRELATGRKAMKRLARKMSGWFLRRTKTLIKDQLPKKEDRTNSQGETVKTLYFSYLAVLQKVANHVALLQTAGTSKQQETLIKRICDQVFSRFPDFVQKSKDAAFETLSDPKYSGKMKVLQQLLNHCRKNKDKVLLFSFSTKLLDVLQQYCMASGLDYRRLDGSTKSEERIKIVKEFNSTQDVNICLVSTIAYRIGQCRDVKVLRLISLGTVEEIMYLRQVYKQQLHCVVVGSENAKRYFEAVQGSKEHRGELFGVYNLFKLRSQGSCLTRDILEREGKVEAGIMTATTWLKEEPPVHKLEAAREPGCQEHRVPEQPAEAACGLCTDFSEDESASSSVTKPAKNKASDSSKASVSPGQLSLLQCGFSKLFETKCETFEDDDENIASDNETSDEQPTCLSTETKNAGCRKSQDSLRTLKHKKLANVLNPNGKCVFDKSEKILEENIPSESDDEKNFKNTVDHHCILQNVTESEDSDIIFPTQYTTQRLLKKNIRFKPPVDGSEDSESENPVNIKNNGDDTKTNVRGNGLISKQLNLEIETLKSNTKRKGSSDISDESDDIEVFCKSRVRKQRATSSLRFKRKKENKRELYTFPKTRKKADEDCNSQTIDEFSSSDDNLSVGHISFSKQNHRPKTIKDKISVSSKLANHKRNNTFIPRKPMTFSNENMTRKEKMKGDISTHTKECQPPSEGGISFPLYVSHPVSQKKKKVCRTDQTTFIIGETPKGIRRKQFEEMASYFKLSSVKEFAKHVTDATSEERQKMLRDFYTSQYPE